MFTATMIFQLIDEGKLSIETPLIKYFPEIPNAAKISIGKMLNHSSGLHNFTADSTYGTYWTTYKSEAEMTAIFARHKSDFEPGAKSEYSNTNFVLLGYIIEKLTGKSYTEELQKRITSKIGLADTYYSADAYISKNETYSFDYATQWTRIFPETNMSIPAGAGAIVSTPADLVKFIKALFDGKLVSLPSLELMKTMKGNYGMGMFSIPFKDENGYGHSGGMDGFSSLLIYFPKNKLAIAYTSNGARYSTNEVVSNALSIYFNQPFAIPEFKTTTLSAAEFNKYVGKYSSSQTPLRINIIEKNRTLYAQGNGQRAIPFEAKGDNKFTCAIQGATLQFDTAKKSFSLMQGGTSHLFTKAN